MPTSPKSGGTGRGRRAALLGAAAGMLAATTLVTAVAPDPGGIELDAFATLNDLPPVIGTPLELVMSLGTSVGAVALAILAVVVGRARVGATVLVAWVAARGSSTLLKAAIDRPRPPAAIDGVVLHQALPDDAGFPSAHAAIAAALAVVAARTWPRLTVAWVACAAAVGVARLHVGVHLPLDLLGGWSLGMLCGAAAVAVVARFRTDARAGSERGAEGPGGDDR